MIQDIVISEIIIENRARKNLGSLDALERSIQKHGVMQPIGITPDKKLIFGERRLRACQNIGKETIPARIFDIKTDDPAITLKMEQAENTIRLDMDTSELLEIGRMIEKAYEGRNHRPSKKSRQNFAHLKHPQDNQYSSGKVQNFAQVNTESHNIPQGKSADIAAKAVGMNRETYRQAKAVVNSGDEELIQQMDSGEKSINAAYKEVQKKTKSQNYWKRQPIKIMLTGLSRTDAEILHKKMGDDYCEDLFYCLADLYGYEAVYCDDE